MPVVKLTAPVLPPGPPLCGRGHRPAWPARVPAASSRAVRHAEHRAHIRVHLAQPSHTQRKNVTADNHLEASASGQVQLLVAGPVATSSTDRYYPIEAVDATHEGYKTVDRGQLHMACGTGKTRVYTRVAARECPAGLVVVLAPSVWLLGQIVKACVTRSATPTHARPLPRRNRLRSGRLARPPFGPAPPRPTPAPHSRRRAHAALDRAVPVAKVRTILAADRQADREQRAMRNQLVTEARADIFEQSDHYGEGRE